VTTTVARVTEISAQSDTSFEDAVQAGIARANQTLRNVRSAWVKEQRVNIEDGAVSGYQVNLMITFELEG
jgi:dodecin